MATRTKVFLIVTKAVLGGAQRYVYDVARGLPNDAYDVTVYSGDKGWLHEACTTAGIPAVSIPSFSRDVSLGKDVRTFFKLFSLFASEKPDIVHLNSSKIGGLGALAARCAGVKRIVFTAHGWAFNEKRPAWQRFIIRVASGIAVLLSDVTVCVSEALRRDMEDFPFAKEKLEVIHLGIEPFALLPRADARAFISKHTGTPADGFWVGTIAELHPNKGIDIGIQAFGRVSAQAEWVIIGGGQDEVALKAAAKNNPHIHFAGHVADARAYLPAFDLFLLPSRTEAFGGVLLEAGIAGVPVIASKVGGITGVLNGGECGMLVETGNPAALSSGIETLITDSTLRERYAHALSKRVSETYSMKAMIEKTIRAYRKASAP